MLEKFTRFPELPAEVRLQIWRNVLPRFDEPALFPYRPDCWQLRTVPASDPAHDPAAPDHPRLEFRHERLAPIRVPSSPLVLVCREANDAVHSWATQQGFQRRGSHGGYERGFDLETDALSLPPVAGDDGSRCDRTMERFCWDQVEARCCPEVRAAEEAGRHVMSWGAITRMALPTEIPIPQKDMPWALVPYYLPHWSVLYVLKYLGNDDPFIMDHDMAERRRFDLDSKDVGVYAREGETGSFEWEANGDMVASLRHELAEDGPEGILTDPSQRHPESQTASSASDVRMLMQRSESEAKDTEAHLLRNKRFHRFEIRPLLPLYEQSRQSS